MASAIPYRNINWLRNLRSVGPLGKIDGQLIASLFDDVSNSQGSLADLVTSLQTAQTALSAAVKALQTPAPATTPTTPSGSTTTGPANQVLATPNGTGGVAIIRALVAADIPTLPESKIANLVTDLAAKAPLASPALTGTPSAPTPSTGDNSTTLATTAFVKNQGYITAGTAPVTSVAGKTGAVLLVESDIANLVSDLALKAPLASPALTGTPTAPTASVGDNSTKLATTAFVLANGGATPASLVTARRRTSIYTDGSTTNFIANGDTLDFSSTGAATSSSQGIALNHGVGVLVSPSGVNAFGLTANLNYNTVKNLSFLFVGAPARITNERFWFGLSDQTTGTMVASDNPAGNYAAFRFSTIAGDTHYQCITKDNTTQTIVDSGITPVGYQSASGPGVLFGIVFVPTAGALTSVQFYINGTLVATITTHLPNSGVAVGVKIAIGGNPTTNNTQAGIFFEQVYVEQDSY